MSWLESKYISLLSHRLLHFKPKGRHSFHFRCPLCGDSKKNEYKTRGTIYLRGGDWWFGCFNCGVNLPFTRWLKDFDKGLYETYLVEKISAPLHKPKKPDQPDESFAVDMDKASRNAPLERLWPLSDVDPEGYAEPNPAGALLAFQYIARREIPSKWLPWLYYTEEYKTWINNLLPGKYEHPEHDEPRLVIPFFDQNGLLIGSQARILLDDVGARLRYMTAVFRGDYPKLWGLNHVDFSKDYYVVEGPLDAMFLENALATCGGKITSEILKLRDGSSILERAIVVYDNEPRNVDVVKNLWKAVRNNYRVVIWPTNISEKDINDMAKARYAVWSMMAERTFVGLAAEQEFRLWNRSSFQPS